jgi:hypothetical protein
MLCVKQRLWRSSRFLFRRGGVYALRVIATLKVVSQHFNIVLCETTFREHERKAIYPPKHVSLTGKVAIRYNEDSLGIEDASLKGEP